MLRTLWFASIVLVITALVGIAYALFVEAFPTWLDVLFIVFGLIGIFGLYLHNHIADSIRFGNNF